MTNIRRDFQNDSSEFYGLIHEMVSREPFIDQEISYINEKGEINCSTVTDYTTGNLNIIKIEQKVCKV